MYDSYGNRGHSPGIQYADDKNLPPPDSSGSGDPIVRPEYIEHCVRELVDVRNQLSKMWAEQYGATCGKNMCNAPEQLTVAKFERDRIYHMEREKLERRESELCAKIDEYKYVASLGNAAVVAEDQYANEAIDKQESMEHEGMM